MAILTTLTEPCNACAAFLAFAKAGAVSSKDEEEYEKHLRTAHDFKVVRRDDWLAALRSPE